MPDSPSPEAPKGDDWLLLTSSPLDAARALDWVVRDDCGAAALFAGVVRDHAEGREGVSAVDYEAYAEAVVPRMEALAVAARRKVADLGAIVLWHRTGRLVVGEASVVVAVSSPHRAGAFEACRYLIDTLKETLPIWKNEHWAEGSAWSEAVRQVRDVES